MARLLSHRVPQTATRRAEIFLIGVREVMATQQHPVNEFSQGEPFSNAPFEVLCEEHAGTYLLPYLCRWSAVTMHV